MRQLLSVGPGRNWLSRWIWGVSITKKLAANVIIFVVIIAILLTLMILSFDITTGVRAYVEGEGLWSKGQKDAIYYLARYTESHNEQDLQKYQLAISIPLGDRKARLELIKPSFDYDVAEQGFLEGGNAPQDVPYMVALFRWFHDVSYMARAIRIWTEADKHIMLLTQYADEIHAAVSAGDLTEESEIPFFRRLEEINAGVTPLERAFSTTLGEAARWIQSVLTILIVLSAALLLSVGLAISFWISRDLRAGIQNLRKGAVRVSQGDLHTQIDVLSGDEIGELATVFNEMIVHRRDAEGALRGATEFREKIMQSATNAIYALDLDRRFTLVNRRTCDITGYEVEELLQSSYRSLFSGSHMASIDRQFDSVASGKGVVSNFETPLVRKDGRVVIITFSLAPLLKDEKIVGVVGTAEDITERRNAEAALEKEREFLKAMLENLAEGIVACDEHGVLSAFNRATREFHGLPEQPLPPERWAQHYDLYLADGVTQMRMEDVPLFRAFRGENVRDVEMVIVPKNKPRRTIVCNGQPLITSAGVQLGAVVALHDITERKRAEIELASRAEELTRSNAELEQFAYVASHDLQAPLRGVIGFCQLLKENYRGKLDKEGEEFIQIIVDSAVHMRELIEGLLAFSRVGRHDAEFIKADLNEILVQVENQLKSTITEHDVEITRDPLPSVNCVPLEINQLFQNLISNAIKFHSEGKPKIGISVQRDGGYWRFAIKDNGIGIKPEHQQRIFQIFQRLHTADEYEGTGIGLAICQKIVHGHGGRIWVESEPGKGATFFFTIKASATDRI